jgi:hypothetical protein
MDLFVPINSPQSRRRQTAICRKEHRRRDPQAPSLSITAMHSVRVLFPLSSSTYLSSVVDDAEYIMHGCNPTCCVSSLEAMSLERHGPDRADVPIGHFDELRACETWRRRHQLLVLAFRHEDELEATLLLPLTQFTDFLVPGRLFPVEA